MPLNADITVYFSPLHTVKNEKGKNIEKVSTNDSESYDCV